MLKTIIHSADFNAQATDSLNALMPGEIETRGRCHIWHHKDVINKQALADLSGRLKIDINCLPESFIAADIKLLITDMDSTLINIECVDEIADFAGLKPEVKTITDAAMRGELDFSASLIRRVALLKGLQQSVLQQVYDTRLQLNPGAEEMLSCLKKMNIKTELVSGGFTFFTDKLKSRLALDYAHANVLDIAGEKLNGSVVGDIVNAEAKKHYLESLCDANGIRLQQALAMGDGANDLLMMSVAGLGIAYRAKPKVQQQADIIINYSGLDAVCDLLN